MEMNESNNQTERSEVRPAGPSTAGRRRFVRGASVLVPVVLTVGSRSAMATVGCLSPSASASIDLTHSRPNRETGSCALGRTPGFWKNAAQNHSILTARDNAFHSLNAYASPLTFGSESMEDVCLRKGNGDPFKFGAHLAAAWCNLTQGWVDTSVLSLTVLQSMWTLGNNFQPVPGVFWSKEQIVIYLKTTMRL